MEFFVLALSLLFSVCSVFISVFASYKMHQAIQLLRIELEKKQSVPDRQACSTTAVVKKENASSDPEDKWNNLKQAFNLSGNTNGRSRTSKVLDN